MNIIMELLQDPLFLFHSLAGINLVPLSFYEDHAGLFIGWIEMGGSGSSHANEIAKLD